MSENKTASKTDLVKGFYKANPYPAYGNFIKTSELKPLVKYCHKPGKFLDAGCGTGHRIVAAAKLMPHLEFWGIDFSKPSLEIAESVARYHNVAVNFGTADLMEPLPFDFKFDYISCTGVLHHLESPERGLSNLTARLSDDGYIFIFLYGEDHHRRRLQIKEALNIILPDSVDHQEKFKYYLAYERHKRKSLLHTLYNFSLRQGVDWIRNRQRGLLDKLKILFNIKEPSVNEKWADQYAHPNERTYNTVEIRRLLENAGLEIVEMFGAGKYDPQYLPEMWRDNFAKLDKKSRYRLMELLAPAPSSPFFAAKKSS